MTLCNRIQIGGSLPKPSPGDEKFNLPESLRSMRDVVRLQRSGASKHTRQDSFTRIANN